MDKRLILAVAGSGKTTRVIENLNLDEKFLILTYTENNYYNIRSRVIQKFGFPPENITVFTYFSFLYSFCFKPFLQRQLRVKGISFERCNNHYAKGLTRYIDRTGRVYANRLVKLIAENSMNLVIDRFNKYFDMIIIDEIQDFAGHDFNLLPHLATSNNKVLFVGDFYQHTFDTSSDGQVNKNLHAEFDKYIDRFKNMGLEIDQHSLVKSHRCSPTVCKYITDELGIEILSHKDVSTDVKFLESDREINEIFNNEDIVKMFYKEHYKYSCYSNNWGNSKGQDHYSDVCVVLNQKTFDHYSNKTLSNLPSSTKNKLYVALTRAKGNVFFIEEKALKRTIQS